MNLTDTILVAGHTGLVGRALTSALKQAGHTNILTAALPKVDLRNQQAVNHFFKVHQPAYVFLSAAKVGGIKANAAYPASFAYDNLMIQSNVIHAAYKYRTQKLIFFGSSCIYPRSCPQPIREEYLLSGQLEKTNQAYAVAKISGIVLCQSYNRQYGTSFLGCMPTNLYGPHDNFELENSHVIPALIAKFVAAREQNKPQVTLWGTGTALREFLYVDDLAQAALLLMKRYEDTEIINIGSGQECTIAELAKLIAHTVGYQGQISFDNKHPDGTPRKLLDTRKLYALGWQPCVQLKAGIARTVAWYEQTQSRSSTVPHNSECKPIDYL